MKKHLRFLLTAVFTFASTIVFGADDVTVGDFTFNLDSKGYAYVKAYNGTAKEIDIPSTVSIDGSNKNVMGIGESAFEGNTTLEKVSILRQYLNYIGDKAFKGCTALKYMNWSESAASNVASATHKANKFFILAVNDIGESAFEGCTSITDINLRWASNLTYGASAFRGCTSLTTASIYAQNINDNAFADCPALNSVYLYSAESVSSSAFALTSGSLRVAYYQLTEEIVEALKVNNASVLKAYLTFDESSYVKVISCKEKCQVGHRDRRWRCKLGSGGCSKKRTTCQYSPDCSIHRRQDITGLQLVFIKFVAYGHLHKCFEGSHRLYHTASLNRCREILFV